MNFEVAIVGLLILFCIYITFYYYQLNKESQINNLIETFNTINEEEIKDVIEEELNWVKEYDTMQHIGWLYKKGTDRNHPSMNLFFDQTDASFLGVILNNGNKKLIIQKQMISDGEEVMIKGELHIVKMKTGNEEQ